MSSVDNTRHNAGTADLLTFVPVVIIVVIEVLEVLEPLGENWED